MGSAFSSPSSEDLLRSYGSIQLLNALAQPTRMTELDALDDATVQSSEPLMTIPSDEVYQLTSQLCNNIGTQKELTASAAGVETALGQIWFLFAGL